jgi:SPOR domain
VWLAYTQGVARGRGETPVLTAANGPEKVAPSQPGGANTPYQGFKIYEQPAPPDDSGDSAPAANTAPPAPKPAPIAAAPAQTLPAADAAKQTKPAPQATVAAAPLPPAKPAPAAATPKPEAKSQPPALKPTTAGAPAPKTMDALIRQAENAPAKSAPAAPVGGPATAAPRQLGNPVAAAPPVPKPAAAPPATGSAVLQIGAYKSQADADTAWKAYKAKHPSVGSYSEDVAKVDLGEKGTWYRLRIAGFGDKDAATTTCAKLKAEGGDCMLAK